MDILLTIISISVGAGIGLLIDSILVCNKTTGNCWFDSPLINDSYYVFHPHENDNCQTLQSKLNLFHPNGTNPTKLDLIDRMNQLECLIELS